jgi:hypothetical protein
VFDYRRTIYENFARKMDQLVQKSILYHAAYQFLEAELGRCGAAEVAGASVAVPYVSAIASVVAVSRLIAVSSGCECPSNEVGRISNLNARKLAPAAKIQARGVSRAGMPKLESC